MKDTAAGGIRATQGTFSSLVKAYGSINTSYHGCLPADYSQAGLSKGLSFSSSETLKVDLLVMMLYESISWNIFSSFSKIAFQGIYTETQKKRNSQ